MRYDFTNLKMKLLVIQYELDREIPPFLGRKFSRGLANFAHFLVDYKESLFFLRPLSSTHETRN